MAGDSIIQVKKELHILILEDVATDVVLINHELRRAGLAFNSRRVETKDEFLKTLERTPPDLIISDHGLPSFDGFMALAIAQDRCPDTPFIFVTGSLGEKVVIESLRNGAVDYVLKNQLPSLGSAVQRALRLAEERRRRKQAEKERLESEERFRMLVDGVKDYAICMLDPEGCVASWNSGAQWITGYIADDILGQPFDRFYSSEDRDRGKPGVDLRLAAAEGRMEEEAWRIRKGGAPFWAHVIITALRDEAGRQRGFVMITRDITERRQTQEALRQSEERYRRLVNLCPDALFVISANRIAFANPAAERLLGAESSAQLLDRPIDDFIHPDGRTAFLERIRQAMERGSAGASAAAQETQQRSQNFTFTDETLVRLDGSPVAVEIAAGRLMFHDKLAVQILAHDVSERKKSEAMLRENEARKLAILETSLDAIICLNHEGGVLEWNKAAERIFGVVRADALGRRLDSLVVPPALREKYLPGLADYLMTGVGSLIGHPIELSLRRAGGEEFPAELAITRVPASEPPLYTVFVGDITERKKAETALRESETRKTAIMETSLDAIVSIDHEGRIIDWNPAAEKIFGYTRSLALGRSMAELIVPPAYVEAHRKGLARFLRTGRGQLIGQRVELTALRANGAEFPVEVTITSIPGTTPPTFTGFIRDITERQRTVAALRQSEERFRHLVEGVADYAICMLDSHGRVVTWNAGAERIDGYRAAEIIGRRFNRLYTREDIEREKPEQALAVAKAEGRFQDEGWCVRKDGSLYWASVVITALRDEKEKLYGFSRIARDITQRKEAEEAIQRLNAELERRVQERTAELKAAYDEMEAYSYSISHDLRAPLIRIAGFAQMLEGQAGPNLDEKSRHHLLTITDAARQMGRMIDDLLAFSRMSRAELHKVRVDLAEVVQSVIQEMRPEVEKRRINWVIGGLPEVWADPALLRNAVSNLLSNAVKYTRAREEARIEIGSRAAAGKTEVFIRDNGVGFDMSYAGKLFGVFQRLHSTAEFEGTGIGLANVRRIIQRHGGRVWAEGAVDGGATFYFSLPAGSREGLP